MPDSPGLPAVTLIPAGPMNAFLIRGQRPVLVDTGLPGSGPGILAALEKQGVRPRDLALIVITHAHIDHSGSAAFLKEVTGAPVLVHAADAEYLRSGASAPATPAAFLGRLLNLATGNRKPDPALAAEPDILVNAPYCLDAFGTDGTIVPVPGHTPGSLAIVLSTGECIAGDLVMGLMPASRVRLPIVAADLPAAVASIHRILDMNPKIFYTGHGGPFPAERVRSLVGVT